MNFKVPGRELAEEDFMVLSEWLLNARGSAPLEVR
jgi:hypothetical protein